MLNNGTRMETYWKEKTSVSDLRVGEHSCDSDYVTQEASPENDYDKRDVLQSEVSAILWIMLGVLDSFQWL